jgi:hypothetical protein
MREPRIELEAPRGLPPGTYGVEGPEVHIDFEGDLTLSYKVVVEHDHGTYGGHRHVGRFGVGDHGHRAMS